VVAVLIAQGGPNLGAGGVQIAVRCIPRSDGRASGGMRTLRQARSWRFRAR
jgi:hypothetical protein